jgi:hypothetical protein
MPGVFIIGQEGLIEIAVEPGHAIGAKKNLHFFDAGRENVIPDQPEGAAGEQEEEHGRKPGISADEMEGDPEHDGILNAYGVEIQVIFAEICFVYR